MVHVIWIIGIKVWFFITFGKFEPPYWSSKDDDFSEKLQSRSPCTNSSFFMRKTIWLLLHDRATWITFYEWVNSFDEHGICCCCWTIYSSGINGDKMGENVSFSRPLLWQQKNIKINKNSLKIKFISASKNEFTWIWHDLNFKWGLSEILYDFFLFFCTFCTLRSTFPIVIR